MSPVRIQKALAEAGVASRRAVEEMILEGRVEVNGQLVTRLPCFVDLEQDRIRVDGQVVAKAGGARTCYLLNKPRGVVCGPRDAHGRPRAVDLVPPMTGQVYCVGALDVDSTGLVLLTNDGSLADRLNHPRYGVPRTYLVEVDGSVPPQAVDKIAAGVFIGGRRAAPRTVKVLRRGHARTVLEVQLVESAGREVRPYPDPPGLQGAAVEADGHRARHGSRPADRPLPPSERAGGRGAEGRRHRTPSPATT